MVRCRPSIAASGEPWTTWPTWPSFLPIVRELLAYASGGQHDSVAATCRYAARRSRLAVNRGSSDGKVAELQIVRPDGRKAPVIVAVDADRLGMELRRYRRQRHLYAARPAARRLAGAQQFAVNVDTAEGDLAKIDPRQLPPRSKSAARGKERRNGTSIEAMSQSAWSQSISVGGARACYSPNRSWPGSSAGGHYERTIASMVGRLAWRAGAVQRRHGHLAARL